MKRTMVLLGIGSWLGLLAALPVHGEPVQGEPAAALQQEGWTARYPLAADGQVTVINVQGSIEVEGWDRAEVELTVIKTARGDRLDDAAIALKPTPDSFRVRTFYRVSGETPVQVDYRLRVPRQARLAGLRTVNGDIRVHDVEGAVEAHTLNGNIAQAGGAGSLVAQAVNGSIRVRPRALPEKDGRLQLETVNGDLYLELPAEADADLELSTVAGRIEGVPYFPAAEREGALRTRLGRGGVPVRLRTIRGSIRIVTVEGEL